MATTPTPISAANVLFQTRLKPLPPSLSPSFVAKCSNPLNINGISDTKSLKTSKNGAGRALLDGFDKATQINELTEAREILMEHNNLLEAEKQVSEARAMMGEAEIGEAERNHMKKKEKLESVKAASISAIVGTLASLPISLTHVTNTYDVTVSTAITIIACALYGATYRYTIRRDLDDFHLKTGTCAAFGIVKGVATLEGQSSLDALSGAICVSENVIIFLLAAAGLDICYKMGILSPFPLETRTKMSSDGQLGIVNSIVSLSHQPWIRWSAMSHQLFNSMVKFEYRALEGSP
ncbi:hypothetical protein L1987_76667 [Smallanthus sonchifolius]|uniref:Uncharacterized protein n=1 Tax=Smallanthus sonchifolius TaxID=185202 RepID=A0ACB8Z8N1_9ASTR|nr:hypothetical protein L1987_76667 [Smallanthus sonchifolius]